MADPVAMIDAATRERPILFSGPMVQAILDGRKSQTRRMVKARELGLWNKTDCERDGDGWPLYEDDMGDYQRLSCPYGKPGDRLWVRETWKTAPGGGEDVYYRADGHIDIKEWPWKPSIFMPRWASRITLEVTGVRVERLWQITEADAIAEGCREEEGSPEDIAILGPGSWTAKLEYMMLWEEINGEGSWAKNPWVWVVSFRRVQ
jgi:hypothetical protein